MIFSQSVERRNRCRSGTGHSGGSCREPETAGSGPDADQLSIGQRTSGGGRNAPGHRWEIALSSIKAGIGAGRGPPAGRHPNAR